MNRTSAQKKIISGNFRPDRQLLIDQVDALRRLPSAPRALSPTARAAWKTFGTQAMQLGTLTENDVGLLELLARTWASCIELEQTLATDGPILESRSGAKKCHPALAALDRGRALAHRLLADLALTPPGRERISLRKPKERLNPFDDF
jgi:P27 family predicted phage terminase small subunit